jgi:hypothetical protein
LWQTALQKRSQTQRTAASNRLHAINPELPFTEIIRQEIIDESLQQARLVMVWRVPGLAQLNKLMPWMF